MSLAVVLAAGGERVIAWEVGVLAGLADAGIDPREADVIVGTSAGALVAARLAQGTDPREDAAGLVARGPVDAGDGVDGAAAFEAFAVMWRDAGADLAARRRVMGALAIEHGPVGDTGGAEIARIARRLDPDGGWPEALRIAVVDAERGRRLVVDAGYGVDLARTVAASRAIPALRTPIRVAGRHCVDGALGSATNADAVVDAAPATVVVVTAAEVARGGIDALWADALEEEVVALRRAGCRVVVIQPGDRGQRAMGPDPLKAPDPAAAVREGRARGVEAAARIPRTAAA